MKISLREAVYSRTWLCVVLPVAFSVILAAVTFLAVTPVFATIDDARVLYVYAGYASGVPEGTYLFSNALWGQLIAGLYDIAPSINWYFLYQTVSTLFGCSTAGIVLMMFGRRKRAPLSLVALVHLLLFVVMYQNALMLVHFEVCAAMWGSSGVVLLLVVDWISTKWKRTAAAVLSAASMLLCFIQEKNTFYASLAFYLLVAFFHLMRVFFRVKGDRVRRMLLPGVAVGSVLMGTLALSAYGFMVMGDRWDAYLEYNPYRVAFWDYDHASYSENPSAYESAGWSEEFYNATQYMYFMDERFNAAALAEIVEPFSRSSSSVDESALTSVPRLLYSLFKTEVLTRWQVLAGSAACLLAALAFFEKKKQTSVVLEGLLCLGGALMCVVLCLYLAWRGRLPLRAWEAISLPGMMVCLGACLRLFLADRKRGQVRIHSNRIIRVGTAAMMALFACVALSDVQPYLERLNASVQYRNDCNNNVRDVERYAMQHPSNIYITGYMYQNYNPFTLYVSNRPINVVSWGSSYYMTPVYLDQMASNNRGQLTSEDILADDVYLIVNKDNIDDIETVFEMLKVDWEAQSLYPVESINERMWVYKVE